MRSPPDYNYGSCHVLAIALHRLTTLPLHACINWNEDMQCTVLVHAWISLPDNFALSAGGVEELDSMLSRYPEAQERSAELIALTEVELVEILGLDQAGLEGEIAAATATAESLAQQIADSPQQTPAMTAS